MKVSKQKYSRWLYVVLVVMIFALISFSVLPLLTTIVQENQSLSSSTTVSGISPESQAQLEAEAKGYELVLQREPDNQIALRGLLDARLKQGDLIGAIAPLERLADLNPSETDYQILLAQAKQQIGDNEGAAYTYRQLLGDNPLNLKALQGLVNLLLANDRPEAALGVVQNTLDTIADPDSEQSDSYNLTSVRLILGQIYANQKRYSEAIAVYEQAFDEDREDFRPVLAKGLVLQEMGQDESAKQEFDTAADLAPPEYKDQIQAIASQPTSKDS